MKPTQQLQILKDIIGIPSENQNEAAVADYIEQLFTPFSNVQIDRLTYAPGRDNIMVTVGNGQPTLVLTGHMDTVKAGDLKKWTSDPFQAEVRNGKLYGRGASDMKSGLAAIIVTLLEIVQSGQPVTGTIKLIGTVGEETGEYGAAQVTKAGWLDGADAVIIAEPNSGFHEITYTAKGVIDYRVTSKGKSAHSARPHLGINAIDKLLLFYQRMQTAMQQFDQVDPVLGDVVHNVTLIKGGEQVNTIPEDASLMGNIRTIPIYPNQMFYDVIEGLIEDLNQDPTTDLKLEYSFPEEAVPGRADSPLMKLAQTVYEDLFGFIPESVGAVSANEAAEFVHAQGDFDIIDFGPGSETSHAIDEYVPVSDYQKAIAFYHTFIQAFFTKE